MKRKVVNSAYVFMHCWCTTFMIMLGTSLPPMIREDELPEIKLYLVKQ